MRADILAQDLDHILSRTAGLWDELRGERILITGGTGFFGCWLLESFLRANDHLGLGASVVVLTRSPETFRKKAPHLALHRTVTLHAGDMRTFVFPRGSFRFVIHAATEAGAQASIEDPAGTLNSMIEGTRRTLDFAVQCGAEKLLFTSSGAVYGRQPSFITHIDEEDCGSPAVGDHRSIYGEGKRVGEQLCGFYASQNALECKIARCFAFAGPYLPSGAGFAFEQFLEAVMAGDAVRISGDGTAFRSYLYAADLMIWLWTILFRGANSRPYNVGSEHEITIGGLAHQMVSALNPGLSVEIVTAATAGKAAERYVPSTQRARTELGLAEHFSLKEVIERTYRWHESKAISG